MIERPSGVSSARLASCAASARSSSRTPASGISSDAMRLPWVMVPVLSSSSVSTSPEASTARPLIAMTFFCSRRSMPAMPIADSNPPMVVGIRQTSSATMAVADSAMLEYLASGTSVTQANRNTSVSPTSRMCSAISFGRLLARGPLDQRDHAIQERLARVGGDAHHDAIRQDLGAARDGRAIAAAFADDGRRLARDGRFVDRSDALDDLAVAREPAAPARPPPRPPCAATTTRPPLRARSSACGPSSLSASCAACPPAPCRAPRRRPRRSSRTRP